MSAYCLGRVIVDLYAEQLHQSLEEVTSFRKYLGGSAGNTAVGLARLGGAVGLISRVGADAFGAFLRQTLVAQGVDTRMLVTDSHYPTGLAFAAMFPPADSQVLFYRKPCADNHLSIADIEVEQLGGLLVVAATALAESPAREAALYALHVNRARGGVNVIDVDWRPGLWTDPAAARVYYQLALGLADVVLANESELAFVGGSQEPANAASYLLGLGIKEVVAKRGGSGAMVFSASEMRQVPAVAVPVMNTLGAGDGFGAAYCYGLLQGWPSAQRLQFAAAAGAIVVSRHSCSEAMPTRAEVEALLAAGWQEAGDAV